MLWFLAVLICLFLFIKFRAFRYAFLAVAGLLVVGIAVYMGNRKAERESSQSRVRADQLVFTDLGLGPQGYGSSYRLTGRVRNTSPYSVYQVKAKFTIRDCDAQAHCDVVGEKEEWDICPLVPPGQVRDVDTFVYFGDGTRVRGQFQWDYRITEIRAR